MERGKRGSSVKRHCIWRKAEPLRPLQIYTHKHSNCFGPRVPNWPFPNWGLRGLKGPWGVPTGPQLPDDDTVKFQQVLCQWKWCEYVTRHYSNPFKCGHKQSAAQNPPLWGSEVYAPRRFALNNNTALIRLVFVALEGWDTLSALGEAPAVIYVLFAPHSF